MSVRSWWLLAITFLFLALQLAAAREGGNQNPSYMDYEAKGREMAEAVEHYQSGQLSQCVNWARNPESELIQKMTHKSGLHLFSKKYPACPLNHKEGRLRGHARKDKDGVLITSTDSLEMCQCIGKLMEMGRLPPTVPAVEESGLLLLNVGAASSRATDMSVAHHLGFESYNYEQHPQEYDSIVQYWKTELASSPRTHVIPAVATYVKGGEGTTKIPVEPPANGDPKKKKKKNTKKKKPELVSVSAVSLDYALRDATKAVAFLHVDVHGLEYHVLKGAYGILTLDKPAVFFQHSANLHKGGAGSHVMCYMKNLGYDCGFYEKKSANVICTHPQQFHFKPTIKKNNKKGKGEKKKQKQQQQ